MSKKPAVPVKKPAPPATPGVPAPTAGATKTVAKDSKAAEKKEGSTCDDVMTLKAEDGLDLRDLAERVYALLREEVRIERERLGRN